MDKPNTIKLDDGKYELATDGIRVHGWRHGEPWDAFNKQFEHSSVMVHLVRRAIELEAYQGNIDQYIHMKIGDMVWRYNLGEAFCKFALLELLNRKSQRILELEAEVKRVRDMYI